MTYIVTDACVRCKYMDCVEVCPVDCFYEGRELPRYPSRRVHRLRRLRARMPGRRGRLIIRTSDGKWLKVNTGFANLAEHYGKRHATRRR